MSAGQESGSPIRENRTLLPAPLPPDEARGTLAAAAGVSTVGLRPPFDTPQRHSHPVCRAILTLIVALDDVQVSGQRRGEDSAAASLVCVFRACSVPQRSAPWRLGRGSNSQPFGVSNSLRAGKNAGNFGDSAFFRDVTLRKHSRIQQFAAEFPTRPSRELIRASRESDLPSREFGAKSIHAPQTLQMRRSFL